FSPVFEFRDDFDRHALALEYPVDRVTRAGTGTNIDLIGAKRREAGEWQAGALALGVRWGIRGKGATDRRRQDNEAEGRQRNTGRPEGSGRSNSHWPRLYNISER